MLAWFLRTKESACLIKVGSSSIKIKSVKDRDNAPRGLGQGRVFHEERFPDKVGSFCLGHAPKTGGRKIRRAEGFSDQVVIGQELIDAGEEQSLELGRQDVCMNIDCWCLADRQFNLLPEPCFIGQQLRLLSLIFHHTYHRSQAFLVSSPHQALSLILRKRMRRLLDSGRQRTPGESLKIKENSIAPPNRIALLNRKLLRYLI